MQVANNYEYADDIDTFGSVMMNELRNVLQACPESIQYQDFGFTEEEWMHGCMIRGDGFGLRFDESYFDLPKREELEQTASLIRVAI